MEFSRQEYCLGLPFPSLGDLPNPRMEPTSPAFAGDSLPQYHLGSLRRLLASKNSGERLDLGSGAAVMYSPDPREGIIHSMKGNRSWVGALRLWLTSPPFCIKSTISCVHVVPCSVGKNRRHRHYLPHFLGCEQILVRAAV